MKNVNPAQIAAWLALGESIIGSELVQKLIPQIGETLKLTPDQKAAVAANIASYDAMIAQADAAAADVSDEG